MITIELSHPAHSPSAPRPRGRGAQSNRSSRFLSTTLDPFDDGWTNADADPPRLSTRVQVLASQTAITYNSSPDLGFDRTINPYKGCEHGCIYCYARPNHAYLGLSPGLDFESRIFAKPDSPDRLVQDVSRPGYKPATIVLGGDTDAYQPIERETRVTRRILEVLREARHPVAIVTKSALILRDLDLLASMAADGIVKVAVSITTLDRRLARAMEPRAATPSRRLQAVEALAKAGVPVTVMAAPMIPGLNDAELERILDAARRAGARSAGYVLLRLPREISQLFEEWLAAERPDAARKIMNLVRQTRGGETYDSRWGVRGRGEGPYADLLALRFRTAVARLGFERASLALRCDLFRPPRPDGQGDLFAEGGR